MRGFMPGDEVFALEVFDSPETDESMHLVKIVPNLTNERPELSHIGVDVEVKQIFFHLQGHKIR